MFEWILSNKEWVFSGIGVFALTAISYFMKKKHSVKQSQKSGHNSTNIQSADGITININSVENDDTN